ncbi:hypothetical protein JCM3765_007292 [Sporobolomyces pararoseus]
MTGRAASKSPAPPGARRSSRHSTPTRVPSPPPTRSTRSSGAHSLHATSGVPSLAPLAPTSTAAGSSSTGLSVPKSPSMRALSPRASARSQRPALPLKHINRLMNPVGGSGTASPNVKEKKSYRVKTQILDLGEDNGHIGIARVKVPVPKGVPGHIIKRFDTNAVSASSMFRAAFPSASEQDEAVEMRWITTGSRGKYGDTAKAGNEDNETKKLSGIWIPAEHAFELAEEYSIQRFTNELISYVPTAAENPGASSPSNDMAVDPEPTARNTREKTPVKDEPVRPPRSSKRARVTASDPAEPQTLSGATAEGVSILQTLSTAPDTGAVTETTEVKLDVPLDATSNGLVASNEQIEAQLAAAKELVESLKSSNALSELADESRIVSPSSTSQQKKRAYEDDAQEEEEEEDAVRTSGTLADQDEKIVDNRSFLGKLFRRKQRRTPVQGGRQTRALPSREVVVALPQEEQQDAEGRRWIAGFGLAVAVGATAAAPYLFG